MNIAESIYTYMAKVTNKLLSNAIIPDKKYEDVKDINFEEVKKWKNEYGIGGVIIDIDGTLRENFEDVDYRNIKWILKLKKELKVCIVSNGNDKKIKKLAEKIGIDYFSCSFKPMKKAFIKAAHSMGLEPENVLVLGDEYISDIFGGQRSNMWAASIEKEDER